MGKYFCIVLLVEVFFGCLKMCGQLGRVQVAETDELTCHSPICSTFETLCHVCQVGVVIKNSVAVGTTLLGVSHQFSEHTSQV